MSPEWVQAIASVATLFAAFVAVWAAFRAPKLAAAFAEEMRSNNHSKEESRRLKLFVFTTLLQYRSAIANPDAVAALNLIDVVYIDAPEVRDAWKDFLKSTGSIPFAPDVSVERYHGIIEKMARHLGLAGNITITDIRSSYYPEGLGEMHEAVHLETRHKLETYRVKEKK